jgi:hypothetical protein
VAEEKQLHKKAIKDGGGRWAEVFILSFLGKVKSYLKSYLANPNMNRACFFGFWGGIYVTI